MKPKCEKKLGYGQVIEDLDQFKEIVKTIYPQGTPLSRDREDPAYSLTNFGCVIIHSMHAKNDGIFPLPSLSLGDLDLLAT
jgi:hypothetical protein